MSKELMQMNIQRAQLRIEAEKEEVAKGSMRQRYHFMPQAGWMNDPNGLLYYKGKYHFFFQHNPYSSFWDCMHWGPRDQRRYASLGVSAGGAGSKRGI